MLPVKTLESNFTYLGPAPEVADMPCRLEGAQTYSVWVLSDEERELIAKGGHIRLGIFGVRPIPPVSLQVVPNVRPWMRERAPCDKCGQEADAPIHYAGGGTHAYRLRKEPYDRPAVPAVTPRPPDGPRAIA